MRRGKCVFLAREVPVFRMVYDEEIFTLRYSSAGSRDCLGGEYVRRRRGVIMYIIQGAGMFLKY